MLLKVVVVSPNDGCDEGQSGKSAAVVVNADSGVVVV